MTAVRFDRGAGALTLRGHAGAGARGSDLVCAALSILAETAAAQPGARTGGGAGERVIRAEAEKLAVLAEGFRLLARDYPDFVSYEEDA